MPSERRSGRIATDGSAVPIGRRAVVLLLGLALAGCAAAARPSAGLPHVVVETSAGPIELEIDSVRAPVTAANFLHWVDARGYDGGSFYRAVTPANDRGTPIIEVVQGGRGLALENAVAGIAHEPTSVTGLRHRAGTISMSRDAPGTATTEFFICVGDAPALDAGGGRAKDGLGFAAFGRVVRGMDVVVRIQHSNVGDAAPSPYVRGQMLAPPILIRTIRRGRID